MPRYILIDNCSGYIFGDTADMPLAHVIDGLAMRHHEITPMLAARWLDEAVFYCPGRAYTECGRHDLASSEEGYHVYRADVGGSDAVRTIVDGQDADTIAEVERDCEYVTAIRCRPGRTNTVNDAEMAEQLVKSISDAEANDRHELATQLRSGLEEVNQRLAADGFAPVLAAPAGWACIAAD